MQIIVYMCNEIILLHTRNILMGDVDIGGRGYTCVGTEGI